MLLRKSVRACTIELNYRVHTRVAVGLEEEETGEGKTEDAGEAARRVQCRICLAGSPCRCLSSTTTCCMINSTLI